MNQPPKEKTQGKPRILIAPLDWGLGHATRCIPIIRELLVQGCDVWIATEGAQEALLKAEFPELPFLNLPGYKISYSKTARGLLWKMIQQGPKMRRAIQLEHNWLKKVITEYGIDAVISDNRYGLHTASVPCAFITHQLTIKSPLGKWTERILQKRNYKYINRFTECWVPDTEGEYNLAGELSHPEKKPVVPVYYIGLLSRCWKQEITEKKNHILIVLSGPEPQRTIVEEKIINDISSYNCTATIVRGLPGLSSLIPSTNMIQIHNHLTAEQLTKEMQEAEYVISRSGYSTVMDVVALQKKSILIPTPGQTEQEYLGKYLMANKIAISIHQHEFSLNKGLDAANSFNYQLFPVITTLPLKKTITAFLHQSCTPALG